MADYRQLAGALTNGDTIQATPRNPMLGGVADLLGMAYKVPDMPKIGVPGIDLLMANRNKVMDLLGIGDVQKTANTLSYGGAVGTGRGMTYRPKEETINAALAIAPFAGKAIRATEGLPVGASTKLIGEAAPQAEAMRLAQQRAALPVSEGGLGLPAGNTAEQRAAAMGFDTDAYHGTKSTDIKKFMPEGGTPEGEKTLEWYKNRQSQNEPVGYMSFRSGSFFSPKPEYAGNYTGEGTGVMYPVKLKMDNPLNLLPNNAGRYGVTNTPDARKTIDAMVLQDSIDKSINEISIINPDLIRSRFAAFDPFRKSAAIAATMGVAAPDLLAAQKK